MPFGAAMGTLQYNGHTYSVLTNALGWFDAEAAAEKMGGHLAKIESAKENTAVFNFLSKEAATWSSHYVAPDGGTAEYVWIGASDNAKEGQWKWSDGSTLKFKNWGYGGEPDNYQEQDAAAIGLEAWPAPKGGLGNSGQWNDVDVTNGLRALVEFDGIAGTSKADKLVGTTGADVLIGLGGKDTLTGGKGKDAFVFNTKLSKSSNVDTIKDFSVKDDTVRLDHDIYSTLNTGKLSAGAFYKGSKAHDQDDRIIYDSAKGALYYDADGNGAAAQTQFAIVSKKLALTAADFLVI
jgi:hypothetical protein